MYVFDIDVIRNGNKLKLKVKSEFSLSMGLMVINHSNPYIHSTTVIMVLAVGRAVNVLKLMLLRVSKYPPNAIFRNATINVQRAK